MDAGKIQLQEVFLINSFSLSLSRSMNSKEATRSNSCGTVRLSGRSWSSEVTPLTVIIRTMNRIRIDTLASYPVPFLSPREKGLGTRLIDTCTIDYVTYTAGIGLTRALLDPVIKKGRAFQFTAKVLLLQRMATLPSSPAETVSVSTANEAGIASQSCLTESHQYTQSCTIYSLYHVKDCV